MLPDRKWDYDFNLTYSVTLGQDSLETSLVVRNTGSSNYDFQILFHSYLAVNVSPCSPVAYAVLRLGHLGYQQNHHLWARESSVQG